MITVAPATIEEVMKVAEEKGVVQFNSDGSEYELKLVDDEWWFSVDGGVICNGPDLWSASECVRDECGDEVELVTGD